MDRGAWWDPSLWGPKELDMTEQLRLLNLRSCRLGGKVSFIVL